MEKSLIAPIIFILILVALIPILIGVINETKLKYSCDDPIYPVQSEDLQLCTNSSVACLDEDYTIYNITADQCQNGTGYQVDPDSGFLVYNESSTNLSLTMPETIMLDFMILIFIIAGIYVLVVQVKRD